LQHYSEDSTRLRSMGERARRRVLSDYSVERAVTGTLEALSSLGRRRGPME
jgi:hypothetical protein